MRRGVYSIAAAYPGVVNPPPQDTFTLIGLSISPIGLGQRHRGRQRQRINHRQQPERCPGDRPER